MDLRDLLFDTQVMKRMCHDAQTDLARLPVQTHLFGDEPLEIQADTAIAFESLGALKDPESDVPLWELQWATLVLIYVSDTLAAALRQGTPEALFVPWFYGVAGTSTTSFRSRFENAVAGQYGVKTKRGEREPVMMVAKTCLEIAVAEVLQVHFLSGLAGAPPG